MSEWKLYVGNLSFETTEAGLREMFSKAGTVISATVVVDKMIGKSRGFGFVEFSNSGDAQNAIKMFHGQEVDGRTLTVNVARPREERPRGRNYEIDFGLQILIDPGDAPAEVIGELFAAFSELNRAVGGEGLIFLDSPEEVNLLLVVGA